MIDKINHYSLNNPVSVYDEEAMTALELAARTAAKVNEAITQVNTNENTVTRAYQHLVTELPKSVEKEVNELAENGELETMLVKSVVSDKIGKKDNESVTMSMLAPDVKNAITGGSVPTVGVNSVNTSNLVDSSVTEGKLAAALRDVVLFTSDYNKPLLIINTTDKTVSVNPDFTAEMEFYCVDKYYSILPSEIVVDSSNWQGKEYIKMYLNPTTKVIHITPFNKPSTNYAGCLNLGRLGVRIADNVIPVKVNNHFYCGKTQTRMIDTPQGVKPVRIGIDRYRISANAVFNIDTVNKSIQIVKGGKYNFYTNHETFEINLINSYIDYTLLDFTLGLCHVFFDTVTNKIVFQGSINDLDRNYMYMGICNFTNPHMSTCIIPFTIDSTYYCHPDRNRRELATLTYSPYSFATKTIPYVDFVNHKLVFPSVTGMWITTGEYNLTIVNNQKGVSYEVPFDVGLGNFQYLVGSVGGLKFVSASEYVKLIEGCNKDGLYYLGNCVINDEVVNLQFECVKGRTVSILGDSISTYSGYIPEGNTAYYKESSSSNVNMMWWKRAMNRCGLALNTNNSNSGSRVTNTKSGAGDKYGVEMCKHLDNGKAPDNIIIYMGVNDYFNGVALGSYNGRGAVPTTDITFREAYAKMLYNTLNKYPSTKVYACTLPTIERTTTDITSPDKNSAGVYLTEFNDAIREIAKAFCVEVIDLESCRINHYNGSLYMYDYNDTEGSFVHPNSEGHRMISHKVIKALLNSAE